MTLSARKDALRARISAARARVTADRWRADNALRTEFLLTLADGLPVGVASVYASREAEPGTPHPRIARPRDLFGAERRNSAGFDPSDEDRLAALADALRGSAARDWRASRAIAPTWCWPT